LNVQRLKSPDISLAGVEEKSTTRLGDWYATDLSLGSKRYILCVAERDRISIILNAAPYAEFPMRLAKNLPQLLFKMGIRGDKVSAEIREMDPIKNAKTVNRSVLGNLKEFKEALKLEHQIGRFSYNVLPRQSLLDVRHDHICNARAFSDRCRESLVRPWKNSEAEGGLGERLRTFLKSISWARLQLDIRGSRRSHYFQLLHLWV